MMFRPRDSHDQRLVSHVLTVSPEPTSLQWSMDVFGNAVTRARFIKRDDKLVFDSTLEIDHCETPAMTAVLSEYARLFPFAYDAEEMPDLLRSMERQMPDPGHVVDRWAHQFLDDHGPTQTIDLLTRMTKAISHRFTYKARHEPGIQDPRTTLRLETGTCRDYAMLMMEAVRALGLAARFVSGYLHVPARAYPGESERHGGGNTHAWLQVYLARRRLGRVRSDQRDRWHPRADPCRRGARPRHGQSRSPAVGPARQRIAWAWTCRSACRKTLPAIQAAS